MSAKRKVEIVKATESSIDKGNTINFNGEELKFYMMFHYSFFPETYINCKDNNAK